MFLLGSIPTLFKEFQEKVFILDEHLKEKNCQHIPKELFEEYEIDNPLESN